jgi:hypothetical protein
VCLHRSRQLPCDGALHFRPGPEVPDTAHQ